MKTYLLTTLCVCVFLFTKAQNTDLPGPSANLQTVPAGSYIIAMDNTLQVNSAGDFNLKAYGLIVYLLNNNVKIKWSIKAGKTKDGIDFSAPAEQIKPTFAASANRDFKAGPFLIYSSDTTGVASLIDAFYTASVLSGTNRPQVYRLTTDAINVDIRYDLIGFRPKAAILTDGGNQNIHQAYMTACAIPSENYASSAGTNLMSNCFTFASEPHNTNTGTAVNSAITGIRDFVTHGGNFLAQCEAINNYENNTLGRFQTTSGITISNANIGTTGLYLNPDLGFSQFEGVYNASLGGSLKNWKIVGSGINNEHEFSTGSGTNSTSIGASVSKLYNLKGGLVFYLGNHSFAATSIAGINGIRMYMNAFLTPSNTNCPSQLFTVLPLKLIRFSGNVLGKKVTLKWTVSENETADRFEVERSLDGQNFTLCGALDGSTKNGEEDYNFFEVQNSNRLFYRLKMVDKTGRIRYSTILMLTAQDNNQQYPLTFINTGATNKNLNFNFNATVKTMLAINVYNFYGATIYSGKYYCPAGVNQFTIPVNYIKRNSSFIIEVIDASLNRYTVKALTPW